MHEELIRNSNISGVTAAAFKEIPAVSDKRVIYTAPSTVRNTNPFNFAFSSPVGGGAVVSYEIPSLLFEDLTLQEPSDDVSKPPYSKHPSFDK